MFLCSVKSPHFLCPGLTVAIQVEFRLVSQSDNHQYTLYWYDRGARGIIIGLIIRPSIQMLGKPPTLQEGQSLKSDWGSMTIFLVTSVSDTQSTQSPCMTQELQPCAGTQPTAATQRPPWMTHLGNVSVTFLSLTLDSKSPTWEALSDIRTESHHILIHLHDAPSHAE